MPFQIVRNDITKMQVDAIVNTANPMPDYGAGTDTAVYEAAGVEKLLAARAEIGVIERGTSAITDGYDLPAKYIIHTVGTGWRGGDAGEEQILRNCYRSVFKVAVDNEIESLAIPLLASGSYGFPKGIALRIALTEIEAFMAESDMDVYLVVFDEKSVSLSTELYGDIEEYINDNYVEEKNQEEYGGFLASRERPRDNGFFGRVFRGAANARKDSARMAPLADEEFDEEDRGIRAARMAPLADEAFDDEEPHEIFADEFCEDAESVCGSAPAEMAASMASMAAPAPERSLEDVIKNLDKTFMELVFSFADARGLTDVEVQKRANLDRKAFSKLKCGTTKNPSKSTALALAIALELDLDDTKDLLSRAGLALSPCSKQDVIVQYFIEKEAYDILEINLALFEHGEPLLGSQVA